MARIPSICIPKIDSNITRGNIISVFEKILGKNCINKIELMRNNNNTVLIYFGNCNNNKNTNLIMDRLNNNLDFKIVNKNQIWKCYKNNSV